MDRELIQIKVGGLAFGGAFVADIVSGPETLARKKVFIRDVGPQEIVEARIITEEKNLYHAVAERIVQSSADRVTPPCPYFGVCGGCDLQHLRIGTQREAKRLMVERTLQFQGRLSAREGVQIIGPQLPEYNYRRRVSLHLGTSGELGFYRRNSGDIVDIHACLLATKPLNEALDLFRPLASSLCSCVGGVSLEESDGEVYVLLKLRESAAFPLPSWNSIKSSFSNLVVERKGRVLYSQYAFQEEAVPRHPAGHFSQVNSEANDILISAVVNSISDSTITELYAGAGNFSIPLAKRNFRVTAVEADEALVKQGIRNATQYANEGLINFVHATCEQYLRGHEAAATVLLDPPRSGIKDILQHFSKPHIRTVIYVSCNLPTLVRDLKVLSEVGFELERVQALDMFSQTHHVETISVLRRS